MSWRTSVLAREAVEAVVSSPLRSMVLLLLAALVTGGLATLELRSVRAADDFQRGYARAGAYVAIASQAPGAEVAAERCAALEHREGVVAAGALGPSELTSFTTQPGVLFQSYPVTVGLLRAWDPGFAMPMAELAGGIAAGSGLADEVGLAPGSFVARRGEEPMRVAAVLDTSERNPQVSRALLDVVAPWGPAEDCWVEFERERYAAGETSLAAWFASGDSEPAVRPYLRADQFTRDPAADYDGRPQRLGWLFAGGLLAAVGWLMLWFRRADFGLYLALGTARTNLLFVSAIESWLLVSAGLAVGWLYALALQGVLHEAPTVEASLIALRTAGLAALVAIALAPLGMALVRGNILSLLKDR